MKLTLHTYLSLYNLTCLHTYYCQTHLIYKLMIVKHISYTYLSMSNLSYIFIVNPVLCTYLLVLSYTRTCQTCLMYILISVKAYICAPFVIPVGRLFRGRVPEGTSWSYQADFWLCDTAEPCRTWTWRVPVWQREFAGGSLRVTARGLATSSERGTDLLQVVLVV